jgi:hypothetical protein
MYHTFKSKVQKHSQQFHCMVNLEKTIQVQHCNSFEFCYRLHGANNIISSFILHRRKKFCGLGQVNEASTHREVIKSPLLQQTAQMITDSFSHHIPITSI